MIAREMDVIKTEILHLRGGIALLDKRMTLKEAVSKYVFDGCSMNIASICAREPLAVAHEIIRQGRKNITYITDTTTDPVELLVAAGCFNRIEAAYIWIGVVGQGYNIRRAVEQGIPNHIEMIPYSNYSAGLRLMAGAMGLPFMPTKSLLGSDIIKYNPDIKVIDDPYGTGPIALVPAATPDVTFIHVQRADMAGNCQIWGMLGNDEHAAKASKNVVITCEEIVPTSEIRKIPNMTTIPEYAVSAVVELPFGCHPLSVTGYYWMDNPFRQEFIKASKSREGILQWLDEWVYKIDNHERYLDKVGRERLAKLQEMEQDNCMIPEITAKTGEGRL